MALALAACEGACGIDGHEAEPAPAPTLRSQQVEPRLHESPSTGTCRFAVDPGAREQARPVSRAVATLRPTSGSDVVGVVRFEEAPGGGLEVSTDVRGLAPGKHAYHIHVLGDCSSPDAKSAGPHFNFEGSSLAPEPEHEHGITGDLGELEPDETRRARAGATLPRTSLQGPYSILGRAVIVHDKPNDPTKPPDGAAGTRLACGVIGVDDADVPKQ